MSSSVTSEETPEALRLPPRHGLAFLPTPLHPMKRFTEALGLTDTRVWIKRDDQTGLATGGNKARKLEFLIADALAQQADTLITAGAVQSNHARQTAAAARAVGLEVDLVLVDEMDSEEYRGSGNMLLDRLLGARCHIIDPANEDPEAVMDAVAAELRDRGRHPYTVPIGGSSAIGATGYAACAREILDAAQAIDMRPGAIVHPTGSGGTQAGLVAGLQGIPGAPRVVGFSVGTPTSELAPHVLDLAGETAELLGLSASIGVDAVTVDDTFVGPGYGHPTTEMLEAVRLVAQTEGILLDPVYTGKAMAGLIAGLRGGRFDGEDVIFLHTGGTAALFAYRSAFESNP